MQGVKGSSSPDRLALASLLAANLLPLVGVLFLDWDLALVLVLFWAESGVIGAFGIAKLAWVTRWAAVFLIPFFCLHFGIFMTVHLFFLEFLTAGGEPTGGRAHLLARLGEMRPHWGFVLGSLVVSHGISFVRHFLGRREWEGLGVADMGRVMTAPYVRVFVMHITILVGAALTVFLGQPVWMLVLLVGLKIAVDVRAHRAERVRAAGGRTAQ